jgi:tetratricopeptide (TPR) repeat protein
MTVMQRRENKRSFENWSTWDYAEALTTVEEIISLMLEDGLEETDTLGEACEVAAVYNLAMGCKEDAIKWATKDLEIERKCTGEDSAEYVKALALLESARGT